METTTKTTNRNISKIHQDILSWKSNLEFMKSEIGFIHQLLNSYIFEPDTPDLFKKIQGYKEEFQEIEKTIVSLESKLKDHENKLSGTLECDTVLCDNYYSQQHSDIETFFCNFQENYKDNKASVFAYASEMLKKRKK